ncbi:hypothetical protein D3C85_1061850 [compost metagenome]
MLTDGHAVEYLRDLLHLTVNLRRADAHTTGVEHGVGTAVDHHPAVRQLLGVIALGPDTGKLAEIRRLELFAVGVVPKADGHRRKVPGANQFAFFTNHRMTVVVPYLDGHAQAFALHFATAHRLQWIAIGKARNDIGATRHRSQADISLEVSINVIVTLWR